MTDASTPADSATVLQATLTIWSALLSRDGLDADADLRGLGADSLMFMVAFVRTMDELRVEVPLADLFRATTAREFSETVYQALSSPAPNSACG